MSDKKCCGTCKYWEVEQKGSDLGDCKAQPKIPDSYPDISRFGLKLRMYYDMGHECPVFKWRESKGG